MTDAATIATAERSETSDWSRGFAEPLGLALDRAAARWPDRPAIDFLGRKISWAALAEETDRLAAGFAALGVVKGDRVAILPPNTPYFVKTYDALAKIGAVAVNLNPLYLAREIRALVEDSGAKAIVTVDLERTLPKALACLDARGLDRIVLCRMAAAPNDPACVGYDEVLALGEGRQPPDIVIDPVEDLAVLQYTGGATGAPRAAMLTQLNLATNAAQTLAHKPDAEHDERERTLVVLPLFHVVAMTVCMNYSVRDGAEMILLPRFDLKQCLRTIHKKRPNFFPAVPTLYNAIDKCLGVERYDLSSLETCISGGAPLPAELKRAFEARTGCEVVEGYGSSEASPVVSCNPLGAPGKPGSIGRPFRGMELCVRRLDDPTRELASGDVSEICLRGPTGMKGYWRNPRATQNAFVDGWLRTGDVVHCDEDGYWYLVDRTKDVVIVNGYNVYPRQIEEALYGFPAISEATVIGIDDPERGQAPKAFVTLAPGAVLDRDALDAFLEERLSKIERPAAIEVRDALPKSLIGKLSKKELVAEERAKRAVSDDQRREGGVNQA